MSLAARRIDHLYRRADTSPASRRRHRPRRQEGPNSFFLAARIHIFVDINSYQVLNLRKSVRSKKARGNLSHNTHTDTQTESWAANTLKKKPDLSACPSFEVLRQENPLFFVDRSALFTNSFRQYRGIVSAKQKSSAAFPQSTRSLFHALRAFWLSVDFTDGGGTNGDTLSRGSLDL